MPLSLFIYYLLTLWATECQGFVGYLANEMVATGATSMTSNSADPQRDLICWDGTLVGICVVILLNLPAINCFSVFSPSSTGKFGDEWQAFLVVPQPLACI